MPSTFSARTLWALFVAVSAIATPADSRSRREPINGLYVCNKTNKVIHVVLAEHQRARGISSFRVELDNSGRWPSGAAPISAGIAEAHLVRARTMATDTPAVGIPEKWTYHPSGSFMQVQPNVCQIGVGKIHTWLNYYWFAYSEEQTWQGAHNERHSFCARSDSQGRINFLTAAQCTGTGETMHRWAPLGGIKPGTKKYILNVGYPPR
jgi:hypothetical protein